MSSIYLIVGCQTGNGAKYMGGAKTTRGGRACIRWDSVDASTDEDFPDKTKADAEDYCRNPSSEVGVWCWTSMNPWHGDFCDVPDCSKYSEIYINHQ